MMLKKFSIPGQFVQMKTVETDKPAFIAIANGPTNSSDDGRFEFLVKRPRRRVQRRDDGRGNGIDGTEIVRRRSLDESVGVGADGERLSSAVVGDRGSVVLRDWKARSVR